MVRWKYCLVLVMLLLLPRVYGRDDDEDDDDCSRSEESEEDEDEEDEDEEEGHLEKLDTPSGRRAPFARPTTQAKVTRTTKRAPLECYVCGYRSEMPLRSCLDPTKYRVHSVTCHNVEDKCFTTVLTKGKNYVAVIRGCRTGCVGSPDTTCCERNRCNNQAFAMPVAPHSLDTVANANTASKPVPPNVMVFVTVLLLLQTVVKVSFV